MFSLTADHYVAVTCRTAAERARATSYRALPRGGTFHHVTDPARVVYTKTANGWYVAPDGRRYRTGGGTMVLRADAAPTTSTT